MSAAFPLTVLLLVLTAPFGVQAPFLSHPVISPSDKYEIVNLNFENVPQGSDAHKLLLKTKDDGQIIWSHPYGRHVDVSWSTVGDVLVVNDYAGSNYTECLMLTIRGRAVMERNLRQEFIETHRSLKLDQYIHVHIQALKWLTPYKLRIEVLAYASLTIPGHIDEQYTFDMRKGFD